MHDVVDIIGCALAGYYNGDKKSELIIREDYRIKSIPMTEFFRDPNEIVRDRIALSHCKRDVLNIGASSSVHSLCLVKKGLKVTSIDVSPVACSIMRKSGLPLVVCGSIFEKHIQLEKSHTWLAIKGAVGQLGNIRKFRQFLHLAQKKIPANGRLILSSNNLRYEGYRTRSLSFEYANNVSGIIPWFDIGVSTLTQVADTYCFDNQVIYNDEHNKYIALLTRR